MLLTALGSQARRRGVGLRIRPELVRQARHEAGLSLAQVARSDVSRTAIHLIETGKSRPSLATLQLIADRTRKPVTFFLEEGQEQHLDSESLRQADPQLDGLELAIAEERFDDAKTEGRHLLDVVTQPTVRGRVSIQLAQAYLQTANVEEALPLLTSARAIFEDQDDKWMLADCLDWQAAAEHLLENPAALSVAHQALQLARSLHPAPARTLVRIYGRIGSICVAQHNWREAIIAYQQAVQAGAGLLDMSRLAKMYNDLSIAYRRIGNLSSALDFARRSVSIHELLQDRLSIGRAETNLALALLRQRDNESASAHLDRALSLFIEADQTRGRAHILLAQAELLRDRGDLTEGRAKAEGAAELARSLGEEMSLSEASHILATIAAEEGNDELADELFSESISSVEKLDVPERLTTVHAAYAKLLEKRGDVAGALKHWRRAVAATHPEAAGDEVGETVTSDQSDTAKPGLVTAATNQRRRARMAAKRSA